MSVTVKCKKRGETAFSLKEWSHRIKWDNENLHKMKPEALYAKLADPVWKVNKNGDFGIEMSILFKLLK